MERTVDPRSTIVYYTSNREEDRFEQVIQEQILRAASGLPIISVSQQPLDFGRNLCVGEVGISNQNAHRQFQIGCQAATTEFVHAAESDTLYPPEYFQFIPEEAQSAYRTPVYLFRWGGDRFYRKKSSESATVIGREYAIRAIRKSLRNRGIWRDTLETGREVPFTFRHGNWKPFSLDVPIINIKTENQMHRWHGYDEVMDELSYWGQPEDVTRLFA
jgi:hypothetical protein